MSKQFEFLNDDGDNYPDWETKKLGTMGETFTGLTGKTKEDFGVGDHEFITYMNVFSNIVANPRMVEKVTLSPDENQNEVKQGDILFTTSSETLKDVGMASLWDTENSAFLNSFCFGFRISDSNVLPRYLVTALHSPVGRKRITFLGQGSTRINISKTKLMEILIPLPSLPEQEKIAEFFSALDERIALTAEKVKLLKEQKTGYLKKIFAQEMVFTDDNGDRYPEWEQKKLGDVASLKNGYAFDSKSYQEKGTYLVTTISNVTGDRYVDSSGSKRVVKVPSDIRKHQVLAVGDILISLTGNVGRVSVVNELNLLLNQRVGLIDLNSDSLLNRDFLYQVLSHERFLNAMVGSGQGAAQKNIKKEDVENYLFGIPSLPEQEKIAEFFSTLDQQIELTENKLTLLKEQKKGYLQGIFG